jgi:hypothetical protein
MVRHGFDIRNFPCSVGCLGRLVTLLLSGMIYMMHDIKGWPFFSSFLFRSLFCISAGSQAIPFIDRPFMPQLSRKR